MQQALLAVGVESRLVTFVTKGDKILDKPLADIGGKGLFTQEIEAALFQGQVDVAVHSLKDMPTVLPEGLEIGAVLERSDVRDVWVPRDPAWKTPRDLAPNARIGTASLRRQVQLCQAFPRVCVHSIRGNLQTRLDKMHRGEVEGLVLSKAGFQRLGMEHHIQHTFSIEEMLPAVGQGALALEYRIDRQDVWGKIQRIHHIPTATCVTLERLFLKALEGSCHTPIGGYAFFDNGQILFEGLLGEVGSPHVFRVKAAYDPCGSLSLEAFACQQAARLLREQAQQG